MGLGGFNTPLSNVTPFTYRDGWTYLEYLTALKEWVEQVILEISTENDAAILELRNRIELLAALIESALANNDERWAEFEDGQVAYDPTTGRNGSVNLVIGHVYDNTRYYAYFAKQLDDFDKTAAQWDAMQYTARHFDLVLAYSDSVTNAENVIDPVDPN